MRLNFSQHVKSVFLWAACVGMTLGSTGPAFTDTTIRTLTDTLPVEEAEWVFINLPIGELEVIGTDDDDIDIHITLQCEDRRSKKCRNAAKDIELKIRRRFDGIEIELERWPKFRSKGMSVDGRFHIPRQLGVEIEMGVGEVDVSGLADDVEIDVGVGDVRVEMEESDVRSVNVDAGVGEAKLRVRGRTIEGSGFIGHGLDWREGPGRAHIEIDCGVGSIKVYLD